MSGRPTSSWRASSSPAALWASFRSSGAGEGAVFSRHGAAVPLGAESGGLAALARKGAARNSSRASSSLAADAADGIAVTTADQAGRAVGLGYAIHFDLAGASAIARVDPSLAAEGWRPPQPSPAISKRPICSTAPTVRAAVTARDRPKIARRSADLASKRGAGWSIACSLGLPRLIRSGASTGFS